MEESSESVVITDRDGADDDPAAVPDSAASRLDNIVESVLFATATPVSLRKLVEILDGPTIKEVQAALVRLAEQYGPGRRGIQLHEVAGGYQLRTARENAEWVRAVFREKPARLGRAALETLAIIAYKQPATRAEIEAIRGVDVDGVVTTLQARRLIKIAGRKEAVGRPLLYSTTPEFLEAFGLKDLTELPSLKELGLPPDAEEITTTATPTTGAADASPPDDTIDEAITEPSPLGVAAHGAETPATATADASLTDELASEQGPTPSAGPPSPTSQALSSSSPPIAEDPEPGGDHIATQGGGADRKRSRPGQRPAGDAVGDESEPEDRSDHD